MDQEQNNQIHIEEKTKESTLSSSSGPSIFNNVTLIVIAVLLVLLAGVFLLTNNDNNNQAETQTFTLEELGVQMVIPAEFANDLVYEVQEFNEDDEQATVAYFSTQSLMQKAMSEDEQFCGPEYGPIGAIARSTLQPEFGVQPEDIREFNGVYVFFGAPQAACAEEIEVIELQSEQIQILAEGFDTVEEIS